MHSISLDATEEPEAPLSSCVSFGERPEWPEEQGCFLPTKASHRAEWPRLELQLCMGSSPGF